MEIFRVYFVECQGNNVGENEMDVGKISNLF